MRHKSYRTAGRRFGCNEVIIKSRHARGGLFRLVTLKEACPRLLSLCLIYTHGWVIIVLSALESIALLKDFHRHCRILRLSPRTTKKPIEAFKREFTLRQLQLNRAVAVAMCDGPEAGLTQIDAVLEHGELANYYLAHSARADMYRRLAGQPRLGPLMRKLCADPQNRAAILQARIRQLRQL